MKKIPSVLTLSAIALSAPWGTFAQASTPITNQSQIETSESSNAIELASTTMLGSDEDMVRVSGSAHHIDEETLTKFEFDDVHRILAEVPGVYIRDEDGYGLRPNIGMRGGASERSKKITLMEDGVLLAPAPYTAPAAYFFPQMTRMTGIEVFKGPSAIDYGPQTVGGALNLVTRPVPFVPEGAVDVALGTDQFAKGHVHVGSPFKNGGFLLEGLRLQSDGFKDLDGGGDTGFEKNEFMGKLKFHSDLSKPKFHQLVLKAGYADETSDETYLGLSQDDFDDNPNRRYASSARDMMEWDRTQFSAQYFFDNGDGFTMDTTLYRNDFERTWDKVRGFDDADGDAVTPPSLFDAINHPEGANAPYYNILSGSADSDPADLDTQIEMRDAQREYVSQGLQWKGQLDLSNEQVRLWRFGARYHRDEIERYHTDDTYLMTNGELVHDGNATRLVTENQNKSDALSLHISYEHQIDRWMLMPGLRYENIDSSADNHLSGASSDDSYDIFLPGFGLSYQINSDWVWIAGGHLGFSPVSPGQTADIDPEKSWNYETGFRYFTEATRGEAILFYSDYSNLLADDAISTGGAGTGEQFNGGGVDIYGLEISAEHRIVKDNYQVPLKLTYTYTSAEFQEDFNSPSVSFWGLVERGDALPYIPEHQGSFSIGYERDKYQLNFLARYMGEMLEQAGDFGDDTLFKTDDQFVVDFAGQVDVSDQSKIYLKVDNLFDNSVVVSRRPLGARPSKPLQGLIGYKYNF